MQNLILQLLEFDVKNGNWKIFVISLESEKNENRKKKPEPTNNENASVEQMMKAFQHISAKHIRWQHIHHVSVCQTMAKFTSV